MDLNYITYTNILEEKLITIFDFLTLYSKISNLFEIQRLLT